MHDAGQEDARLLCCLKDINDIPAPGVNESWAEVNAVQLVEAGLEQLACRPVQAPAKDGNMQPTPQNLSQLVWV